MDEKRGGSNVKPTSTSLGMGRQSSSTEPAVPAEELQEKSQQTELTENLKDFHMLLENISKSLNEMEKVFKSASSSSNATTESLADIKSFFNMSVDVVLLDESRLSKLRKAAEGLVGETSILGKDKCDRLKKFINEIDREVNRLSTAVEKEKKRAELEKARASLVDTLNTRKTEFQPCRDKMQEMVSKQEELEKNLRDYEMLMIQKMPHFKKVYSQQKSSIQTDISGFREKEQLLQQLSQEIDNLRKEPSIDWTGLIAAFYN
ncbi:uncharacterized protein LOC126723138 isoform X2 [Quercus robur]|uniref:uncharacterized protein LOC126723138 isoform X1 n=1 Tax=Quercus robur TaxID=38942 RepID=UPI002162CBD3|nr:uncharacterized protein LOC126723138 isoform X1 [Quercus robur]XP_050282386.1 uncharacterized protein LOC126723138 isoform X2 [Quercus robur]